MTDNPEQVPGELSQAEKREVLLNDLRVARERSASTYHQFATDEADTPRGRYATVEKASVVGVSPPTYPPQPEISPWRADPVPDEPPLGFSVSEMVPVGEPHEIRASIAAQDVPSLEPFPPFSGAQGNSPSPASDVDPSSPLDVERRDAGLGLSSQQDDGSDAA